MTAKQIQKLLAKHDPADRHAMALALQSMEKFVFYYTHDVLWAESDRVFRVAWPIELGRELPCNTTDERIIAWELCQSVGTMAVVEVLTTNNTADGKLPRCYISVLLANHVLITIADGPGPMLGHMENAYVRLKHRPKRLPC